MSCLPAFRRVAACLLSVAASVAASVDLRAQSVIVCWGDSILAGFNSSGNTTTPTGPAPFGDPIPGAHRWDAAQQGWVDITPYQNHFGTSADPIYGIAAGWRRFHGGDVYIVSLAVSGSDATPMHPNPLASWHPSVPGGAFERLVTDHLSPALATLAQPDIRAVCFAAGNNHLLPTFDSDINAINSALSTFVPWSTPRYLAIKTYLGTANDPQTLIQRQAIDQWAATSSRRHAVETVSIPVRTGGLVDGFHLSHYGSIFLGFWAAVTEFFQL